MRTRFVFGALSVALLPMSRAAADEPSSADLATARTLGIEGMKLADEGNCKDAVDRLRRAENIHHAPTTLERLGECQIQVGQIVDGLESLRRVMRENASGNEAFQRAQDRARDIFDKNHDRPGKLTITVSGGPASPRVTLDGNPVPAAVLGIARSTDPGEHVIAASAAGYKSVEQRVKLSEKGSETVAIAMEVDPNAPKEQPKPVEPLVVKDRPTPGERKHNYVPAILATGVGVAGVAFGGIFGAVALSTKSNLDNQCQSKQCPDSAKGTYDSARTQATLSTVGFIVGAIGLAAGITLFVFAPSSGDAEVRAAVGPGSVGLAGKF
jgi:hypothetical protein